MARQGANIYQRKDGRFEARIVVGRDGGRTKFVSVYGRTRAEARRKQLEKYREVELSRQVSATVTSTATSAVVATVIPTVIDFKTLSKNWLEYVIPEVKESTAAQYQCYLKRYIWPELGTLAPADLGNAQVSDFLHGKLTGGEGSKGLAPKTVREIGGVLKRIRRFAVKRNIAIGYSEDCLTIKDRPKTPRVLKDAELQKLNDKLHGVSDLRAIGCLLAGATGIRIGELCALKSEDINLEEGMLYIQRTLQRIPCMGAGEGSKKTKIICTEPKTQYSIRKIPLPKVICDMLADHLKPGTYLLTGRADKYCEPRNMQYYFDKILKSCGIDDATFHTLRHSFATNALAVGMDVKTLSNILGHSSVNITLNRYVHPSVEQAKEKMEEMTAHFMA